MTYPQPNSNQYAVQGTQFFRLLTPLTSPGDLYESEQSSSGLTLGPQSDVANVTVAYFDDQAQTFVNTVRIGPPRSYVGRVDARNDETYAPAGRPARLLIWPSDLYDPSFLPTNFDPLQDSLTFITPVLDVVEYFQPQGSLVPVRADKTFRFPQIQSADIRNSFLVLPYWGRKYASCRVFNGAGGTPLAWRVSGISYFPNDQNLAIETIIDTVNILAPGATHTTLVRAATHGVFDALMIEVNIEDTAPTPFEVVVSDTPA